MRARCWPMARQFAGFTGLQQILSIAGEEFARAFTERLMTYALARGVGPQDMPAVRAIAKQAAADGYRVQTIIRGIRDAALASPCGGCRGDQRGA